MITINYTQSYKIFKRRQSLTHNAQEAKFDVGHGFAFWFDGGPGKTHNNVNNNIM